LEASQAAQQPAARSAQPYGEIFDRGYQHYTGQRLGRRHAVRALIWYSVKRGLGIKKKWSAKIIPILIYLLAYIPAVITIAILAFVSAAVPGEEPTTFSYPDLNQVLEWALLIFAAALAPEMLCDDRRENVLPLYFARPITRVDYLIAKIIAMFGLMATVAFGPPLLLFLGKTLLADNPISYLGDHVADLGRIAVFGTLVSAYYAAISLAIAAYTNRKGVAAAIMVGGALIVSLLANGLFDALESSARRYLVLVSPLDIGAAISHWMFGGLDDAVGLAAVELPSIAYVGGVLVLAAIASLVMYRRYLAEEL
jgi:ABC-2 type transport system permease protein